MNRPEFKRKTSIMILKHLSITELNFSESWKIGWDKINSLSKLDKYMIVFWFFGPFIYLIERDPADLWLTLICLIFLTRCIKRKDWSWVNQIWFKSALALWIFGLFSAVTGPDPFFSFQQSFVWIRFPLYAAAAQVWLAKDRDIRVLGMFFPLQQFGSFFGQWGNLFIWISIGFALAQVQNFKVRDK